MHASFQPLIGSLADRVCGIAGGLGCATQVVRLARSVFRPVLGPAAAPSISGHRAHVDFGPNPLVQPTSSGTTAHRPCRLDVAVPPPTGFGRFPHFKGFIFSVADRDSSIGTRGVHATRAVRPSAHDALDGWSAPEHLCAIGRTWTLGRPP